MPLDDLRIEVFTQEELPWDEGYNLYLQEEIRRMNAFQDEPARRKYQAERQKLHSFLRSEFKRRGFPSSYYDPAKLLALCWSSEGKPRLASREFEFSISHSGDYFALVSSSQQVGVDLEVHKQRSFVKLSRRFFHKHESEYLAELSHLPGCGQGDQLQSEFYRIWTLKEAWVKCRSSQLLHLVGEDTLGFHTQRLNQDSQRLNQECGDAHLESELNLRFGMSLYQKQEFVDELAALNSYEFQGDDFSLSVVRELQVLDHVMSDPSFRREFAQSGQKEQNSHKDYKELKAPLKCHFVKGWTPLRRLGGLERKYADLNAEFWMKDDSKTHDQFGGNKIRKLEYLVGAAYEQLANPLAAETDSTDRFQILRSESFREMVTLGFSGSNHCVATSLMAKELSKKCSVYLKDQHPAPYVFENLQMHSQLGTRIWKDSDLEIDKPFPSLEDLEELVEDAQEVLWVPPGGTHPNSHWAYVEAVFEFAWQWWQDLNTDEHQQSRHQFPTWNDLLRVQSDQQPDVVYMACGTMGSVLGLIIGFRLLGWKTRVQAVQVVPDFLVSQEQLLKQLNKFNRVLRERGWDELEWSPSEINLVSDQFGQGYALPTEASTQAVNDWQENDDVKLEWTYTGKVVAAIEADAQSGVLQGQKVVFWNTYGGYCSPTMNFSMT